MGQREIKQGRLVDRNQKGKFLNIEDVETFIFLHFSSMISAITVEF